MNKQKVVISDDIVSELNSAIAQCEHDKFFILTDSTTVTLCLPLICKMPILQEAITITIPDTDTHKDLESVVQVWQQLSKNGATRHSLLINLGGGMVTDLGGFAASTFKRGISFINIPTTLLSMVDASVGGKTGFNFNGLKNEIGVFNNSDCVIIDTHFLKTMDHKNLCSGYAEMLKHGLISNDAIWAQLLQYDLSTPNLHALGSMIGQSVKIKENIVTKDPTEQGLRKALNLGHTIGHAFESFALQHTPILHGYAVAYGLIAELYLSAVKTHFPQDKLRQTVGFIKRQYGKMDISCKDYDTLIELMTHDKKNTSGNINFTLLADVGDICINQTASNEEIKEALDFYCEC